MAIKKSELYSKLWEGANALRGGMEPAEYKNYILSLLFLKYISDKKDDKNSLEIPPECSYEYILSQCGSSSLGEKLNMAKKAIEEVNEIEGLFGDVDFCSIKLAGKKKGSGMSAVNKKLEKLVPIFKDLDFAKNRASGDDILGDAYEYLMKQFASASGKSKGEFYTPSEVSELLSLLLEIGKDKEQRAGTSIYDPTCGSGSLLLKVASKAKVEPALYGQEHEATTAGLCKMNMYIHGFGPHSVIENADTISDPRFLEKGMLKRFDYAVANPPFSLKNWADSLEGQDIYNRFDSLVYEKGRYKLGKGDFAFLLHMLASLKSTGKMAIILPHGVLFRSEEEGVRKDLLEKGLIKAIIGLPANLFFGTGIPASIIVLDKNKKDKDIFMIDASLGYKKEGNKNVLRYQDILK